MKVLTQKARTVLFQLPLASGNSSYFSGYLIADGLYISCRHGFISTSDYDQSKALLITSDKISEEVGLSSTKNAVDFVKNRLIVYESEAYDIVLFKYGDEKVDTQSIHKTNIEPKGGSILEWYGGGYPLYGGGIEEKCYKDFRGEIESVANNKNYVDVSVSTEAGRMHDWKEASGSPVFIKGTQGLAAILCKIPEYQNINNKTETVQNQIVAVQLHKLWDDKEEQFQKILDEYKPQPQIINKQKLEELLGSKPNADLTKALILEFGASTKSELLDKIISANKQRISDVCTILKREKGIQNFLSLAMIFQHGGQSWLDEERTNDKPYVDSPHVSTAAIEYAQASKKSRKAELMIGKDGEVEAGKYSVTSPPFSGRHSGACDNIEKDIDSSNGVMQHLDDRILEQYNPKRRRRKSSDVKNENFRKEVLQDGYYLVVDHDDSPNMQKNIREIYDKRPEIEVVNLAKDEDGTIEIKEDKIFDPLKDFYK